jgi:hypothetical protein
MWRAEYQHLINLGVGVYWDDHDRWRVPLVMRKTLHFGGKKSPKGHDRDKC